MDDKTLVERKMVAGDIHAGTYADLNRQIEALQSRIEALEAALQDIKNAVRIGPVTDIVAWQRLGIACQAIATKALESQP